MAGREWTTKELSIMEKHYSGSKMGVTDMLSLLPNRTASAIHSKAHLMKLKATYKGRQNFYDVDFWKDYNEINSYWGGFSAADGCIHQRQDGGYTFSFLIQEDFHIQKFIDDTKGDYIVRPAIIRPPAKQLHFVKYNVGAEWVEDLKTNFNIVPRKTWNMKAPEQIPNEFFPYFLTGFIDGDGCWHVRKNGDGFSLSFVLASRDILEFINKWISEKYSAVTKKKRNVLINKHGFYTLIVAGKVACELFLDLRKLIPSRHLSRKWDDAAKIDFCNNYLKKHGRSEQLVVPKTPVLV